MHGIYFQLTHQSVASSALYHTIQKHSQETDTMSKETKETKVTNPTIEWRVPKPKNKVELIPQAEAAARQSAIELNRQIVYIR